MPILSSFPPSLRDCYAVLTLDGGLPEPLHHLRPLPGWQTMRPDNGNFPHLMLANSSVDPGYPFYYFELDIEPFQPHHDTEIDLTIGMMVGSRADSFSMALSHTSLNVYSAEFVANRSLGSVLPGTTSWKAGDTVGCGFSRVDGCIFCTKNGEITGCTYGLPSIKTEELRPVSWARIRKPGSAGSEDEEPYLSIRPNLGERVFAFDMIRFTADYVQGRKRKFSLSAKSLPEEIKTMIGTFAALKSKDDLVTLSRLSMVCRTWAKICHPVMFEHIHLSFVVRLHQLRTLLHSAIVMHRPRTVMLGGTVDKPVDAPSLPLLLSTLGRHLSETTHIGWCGTHWANIEARARQAPPRIEAAIPALLRPLRHLSTVSIASVEFTSLSALLRVLRGLPRVRDISLTSVSVLQASERFFWPASLRLTELRTFEMSRCRLPTFAIPILMSIGLTGRPETTPHIPAYSERLCGAQLHPTDESVVWRIAHMLGRMPPIEGEDTEKTLVQWSFVIRGEQKATSSRVYHSDFAVAVELAKTSDSHDAPARIGTLRISLLYQYVRPVRERLSFLDTVLADILRDANPSLVFQCRIHTRPEVLHQIRTASASTGDVMPLLRAAHSQVFFDD